MIDIQGGWRWYGSSGLWDFNAIPQDELTQIWADAITFGGEKGCNSLNFVLEAINGETDFI